MEDKDNDKKEYTDEEKVVILTEFANKLLKNQKSIPPEFAKIFNDEYFES